MERESQVSGGARAEAERALAGGDWERARDLLEPLLTREEHAATLEALAWAGWWLADEERTMGARERAYRVHRDAGDPLGAGRVATWLAADFREFRGEEAVGRGWLERAHRLLDPLPESPEHGWLALIDADFALNVDRDMEAVLDLARAGTAVGRRLEVPDLEAVGLALEGLALVGGGSVGEGLRLLDEAATLADTEEMRLPLSSGWALCCALSACDGIGDFRRAGQWCEAVRRYTDRWGGRQLLGVCRTSYGRILATGGDWPAAESELLAAVADMESRPGMAAGGLVRLGELRARQGRSEEARRLFERAGPAGLVGRGELALAEGDAAWAADAAERLLRRLPETSLLDRVPALELLSAARLRLGELDAAAEHAAAVEAAALSFGTPYAIARAALCAARVAAGRGDGERARRSAEDAVDSFEEAAAPYDAAHARLELSRALLGLGRVEAAREEAAAARDVFSALGAERDRGMAEALVSGDTGPVAAPPGPAAGGDPDLGDLTAREVEILRLVARGMGDGEIAAHLVLSPHTVHRHVANIRTKLGLPSRSAAVAYAAGKGLL